VQRTCILLSLVALLALAGCGSSSKTSSTDPQKAKPASTNAGASTKLDAPAQEDPAHPAPGFTLRNSLGRTVSLSQYKGKAVLLTFIYDHCPDVCPLIVSHLHTALTKLGPAAASKVQVIAVSVDPKGDTPKTVKDFLHRHLMTGRMDYLIGSKHTLAPVWREWGVQVQAAPDGREVGHSAFVYGITGSGMVKALYPSNLDPKWIVHDVPILAAS
jgi:protein SCO1/2